MSPPKVSVSFAQGCSLAAIVAAYSARLSRFVLWDTKTDKVTRSTWLKARVIPLGLSADGEHLAYCAMAAAKGLKAYLAISRPPYSTALFFQPCFHLYPAYAAFGRSRKLLIAYSRRSSVYEHPDRPVVPRMETGCPYDVEVVESYDSLKDGLLERFETMRRESKFNEPSGPDVQCYTEEARAAGMRALWPAEYREMIDARRPKGVRAGQVFASPDGQGRYVICPGDGCLYVIQKGADEPQLLFDFNNREFEEVSPPDWAKKWTWKRPKNEYPRF